MITFTLVAGSLPLTLIVRRAAGTDSILLVLYTAVLGAALARLALPYMDWEPTTETLFGILSASAGE